MVGAGNEEEILHVVFASSGEIERVAIGLFEWMQNQCIFRNTQNGAVHTLQLTLNAEETATR